MSAGCRASSLLTRLSRWNYELFLVYPGFYLWNNRLAETRMHQIITEEMRAIEKGGGFPPLSRFATFVVVGIILCVKLALAQAAAICIKESPGQGIAVGVEEDGKTWKIESKDGSALGKIVLNCSVSLDPAIGPGLASMKEFCVGRLAGSTR